MAEKSLVKTGQMFSNIWLKKKNDVVGLWSFSPEEMRGLMEDLEAAFGAEEDLLTGEI